jgi:hypothetical protein
MPIALLLGWKSQCSVFAAILGRVEADVDFSSDLFIRRRS